MTAIIENSESQKRQYVDAESVFDELRRVRQAATQTRGGMIWREISGGRYLIRTSPKGAHKSLGPDSAETRKIFEQFTARKGEVAQRLSIIEKAAEEQRRLNRALRVGRVPSIVVRVLNALDAAGLSAHFTVVGTRALYAYESACGVRFMPQAMATRDIDLPLDTRKHLAFLSRMKEADASFLGLLRKVDNTFVRLEERKETARNAEGFEVDVIRRVARDGDPHPLRLSDQEDDIWAVQATTGARILAAPAFDQMVVGTNGEMAMMHTMHPLHFVETKRMLASLPARDPLKSSKDRLQADLVEALVRSHMPQYATELPDRR
ncbi:GSU2403 family nucleotidyltransferase fold protein [Xenophilus arseniciresistens]|uniref:GSU2403 family nucleotidyltransferase fold protein n=1 Tax=Xenophilus arseniciresistens TaxID=1283306 RepID=A0AAE3NAP1_9BURK|nr:GSU2403 family nucleotidyltransferase fold protein [Xenophilus arseniciresistens]MDA7417748.1 GSU2403 family nucleotidyltransferase fold protein [Xenophilus arseniciresistens]